MLLRMLKELFGRGSRPAAVADLAALMLLAQLEALCAALRGGDAAQVSRIAAATLDPALSSHGTLMAIADAGALDSARRLYEEIVESPLDPRHAGRAWEYIGYCHALEGNVEQSASAYGRALQCAGGMTELPAPFHELYHRGLAVTQTLDWPRRRHRFHHLLEFVEQCGALEGDCAECGCWRGLSSFLICTTLRRFDPSFDGRGYHIFDSFQGLSEPTAQDGGIQTHAGAFSASQGEVSHNLARFPGIAFHPGWIPASFAGLPERRYRFVHVDVDLFEPTDGAIRYFLPRLVPGGLLVCDDFNWPGARKAIEDYCAAAGMSFSANDTNQAVIRAPSRGNS